MTDSLLDLTKLKMEMSIIESELETLKRVGTKTSGVRGRAHAMNLKRSCDVLRKNILTYQKELKTGIPDKAPATHDTPAEIVEPEPEPVEDSDALAQPILVRSVNRRKRRVPVGRKQK